MPASSFSSPVEPPTRMHEALLAAGLQLWERPETPGLLAFSPAFRSVTQVGDALEEGLWVCEDGWLCYRAGWQPPKLDDGRLARYAPSWLDTLSPHAAWHVHLEPGRDPSGRWGRVQVWVPPTPPEELAGVLSRLRELAIAHQARPEPVPTARLVRAPYYLWTPGAVATYREVLDGAEMGWARTRVVCGDAARVRHEQTDSRGDRYGYELLSTDEGVAVEVRGEQGLVVYDWIWRFPLVEREWTEEGEGVLTSFQLYALGEPVATEAGLFSGCLRLTTLNANGSSMHTYHPTTGLVLSEFSDDEGLSGRRELVGLAMQPETPRA